MKPLKKQQFKAILAKKITISLEIVTNSVELLNNQQL
jgi:hypothetical protein